MRPHIRLHDWSHLSRQAARSLAKADIPDLDFSLRELMREAKKSGNSMLGCQNHFRRLIGRRCRREPLQYITRYWPFRDCTLRVRSPVLIPRPETEDLVELARLDIETLSSPSMDQCNVMLDVGTGSGAIVVSFLSEVQGWTAVALDVSAKAINLARLNAIRNHVDHRASFINASLDQLPAFDLTVSLCIANLPYIPSEDVDTLDDELLYEDRRALDGGDDGLEWVARLLATSRHWLAINGRIWLETDITHQHSLPKLVSEQFPWLEHTRVTSDRFERYRFHRLTRVR
eukprot:TRINITY_DN8806_c0_g1_i3.p1 TRINITY_DN8806_c0_g1~~TRINITY_DN8806_c0_g1_i3.p1  ORF type:complete len:288 (+),score=19.66 TRINITY_DN8806_c0_g1_i3:76-939(+)